MTDIQAIIFDCDGTLVDSEHLCNLGLEIKLREYHVDVRASQLLQEFRGVRLTETLAQLQAKYQLEFDHNFVPSYRSIVEQLFEQQLQAIDGAESLLAELNRCGIPFCVASNGPLEKMLKSLSITGLIKHIPRERLISAFDVNCWKPDPGLFLHAAKTMTVEANHCAVVEDSIVGIRGAIAAKMTPVLLATNSELLTEPSVHRIRSLHQLKNLLAPQAIAQE